MHEPLRDHLEAIAGARDVERLLDAAAFSDCTRPAALEWVRRWLPRGGIAVVPACGCAAGRCGVCN